MPAIKPFFIAIVLTLLPAGYAAAEVPGTLHYQGYLTDASGIPLDQTVSIVFTLYSSESGGTAKWTDTRDVDVSQGLMSVELGVGSPPIPQDLFATPLWLGISVGGDMEMTPRRPLGSSGFAFKAADSATLQGSTLEQVVGYAQGGGIPPGARIPVTRLRLNDQQTDIAGANMMVDGRSVVIALQSQILRWEPLALEYTYPLGSPSPLGNTVGQTVTFMSVRIGLVGDTQGDEVAVLGDSMYVASIKSRYVFTPEPSPGRSPPGSDVQVHETVLLDGGSFQLEFLSAPVASGPVELVLNRQGQPPQVFFVQAVETGARTYSVFVGGDIMEQPHPVTLRGVGPAALEAIMSTFSGFGGSVTLAASVDGTPLPVAEFCELHSIDGLSPRVLDDGVMPPVETIQADRVTYICATQVVP